MNPVASTLNTAARIATPAPALPRAESAKDAARRLAGPMLAKGFIAEALHTYRDADGNPIYSRIRARHPVTGEKWIRPMYCSGSRYVLGEPKWDGPKPIYNRNRLATAAPDAPCYIVEGEKAADALTRLGVLNTTSGGADSAGKADWTPLKGRPCVIWPDNDEPGRKYGEDVAGILRGLGCPVWFVDVGALHLPDKGDAADWVPAHPGATADDVHALVRIAQPPATEAPQSTRAGLPMPSPSPAPAVAPGAAAEGVQIIRADSIAPEPVDWLWDGYLAAGKVHIMAGAPGTGKTTLALSLAATVSIGGRWPDGSIATPGDVLIWSGEDTAADTLVPRLMAAGAELSRAHFVGRVNDPEGTRPFDPAGDFPDLELAAARMRNLRLVIVDPIVSAVAGDSHKGAEVRRGLQPLVDFAERTRCAVLGISHFSKGSAGKDVVERVTGSHAFGALARIVLATAKAPEDAPEAGRLMVRAKSNLGPDGGGFRYELRNVELSGPHAGIEASRVEWADAIEGGARELLAAVEQITDPEERSDLADAKSFLADLLADGPVPAKKGRSEAEDAGHSWATIRRAMKALGVESEKDGMRGPWRWRLPPKVLNIEHLRRCSTDPEDAHSKKVSTLGGSEHLRSPAEPGNPSDSELL